MAGRSLCVPGQPDLHSKTLFGKKKTMTTNQNNNNKKNINNKRCKIIDMCPPSLPL